LVYLGLNALMFMGSSFVKRLKNDFTTKSAKTVEKTMLSPLTAVKAWS